LDYHKTIVLPVYILRGGGLLVRVNDMNNLLKISSISQDVDEYFIEHMHYPGLDAQFVFELTQRVQEVKGAVYHQIAPSPSNLPPFELQHGPISPAEIIVALSSAGIFTAVYQTISSYLIRNQARELTLTKGKVTITIKGHSLPEETELLKKLAPELLRKEKSATTKVSKK